MAVSAPTLAGRNMQPQKTCLAVKLSCAEQEFGLETSRSSFQPTGFTGTEESSSVTSGSESP